MQATALPRLLLHHPAALWLLLPLFWAVAFPLFTLGEAGFSLRTLWDGTAPEHARLAAWHLAVLVPAVLGIGTALVRSELEAKPFSWMLPGLQPSLRAGTILLGAPLAMGCAFLGFRTAPAGLEAAFGAAAGALGLFWFVAPCAVDRAFPTVVRWTVPLVMLAAAVRPRTVVALVEAVPWFAFAGAMLATAVLLHRSFTRHGARERHVWLAARGRPGAGSFRWIRGSMQHGARNRGAALAPDGFRVWVRAGFVEGGAGSARAFLIGSASVALFAVLYGYTMNMPGFLIVLAGVAWTSGGPRLGSEIVHPLSRRHRADLAIVFAIVGLVLFVGLSVATIGLVGMLGIPPLPWASEDPGPVGWVPAITMTVAFAPIGQWVGAWWVAKPLRDRVLGPHLAGMLAYVLAATFAAHVVSDVPSTLLVLGSVATAALGYFVLWPATRWRYARVDLVSGA